MSLLRICASGIRETIKNALLCHASAPTFRPWGKEPSTASAGAAARQAGATRERGRPARMHSRCVPASFPAMPNPATVPAATPWARPKRSPDATRERGRPARMHSRCVLLRFPAMRHPSILPAATPWARPKRSPRAFAGRACWRRWPRLCQELCGRDARAPGWVPLRRESLPERRVCPPPARLRAAAWSKGRRVCLADSPSRGE